MGLFIGLQSGRTKFQSMLFGHTNVFIGSPKAKLQVPAWRLMGLRNYIYSCYSGLIHNIDHMQHQYTPPTKRGAQASHPFEKSRDPYQGPTENLFLDFGSHSTRHTSLPRRHNYTHQAQTKTLAHVASWGLGDNATTEGSHKPRLSRRDRYASVASWGMDTVQVHPCIQSYVHPPHVPTIHVLTVARVSPLVLHAIRA